MIQTIKTLMLAIFLVVLTLMCMAGIIEFTNLLLCFIVMIMIKIHDKLV